MQNPTMQNPVSLFCLSFFLVMCHSIDASDLLSECRKKMNGPLERNVLSIRYHETQNELYHSPEPWQQLHYSGKGFVRISLDYFIKNDTLNNGRKDYYSQTRYKNGQSLYFVDYGEQGAQKISKKDLQEFLLQTLRFSPALLLEYIWRNKKLIRSERSQEAEIWSYTLNKNRIRLYISLTEKAVSKVEVLSPDELRGDVLSTYLYSQYQSVRGLTYPKIIQVKKYDGRVEEEVSVDGVELENEKDRYLPRDSTQVQEELPTESSFELVRYNEHIYFGEFKEMGERILVVEFRDFFVVDGAPLTSGNGERIVAAIRKLNRQKPIRYFTFGHHHPHYVGGMRAFVHKGATVICPKRDEEYVRYLVKAQHSIEPDSLQLEPRELKLMAMADSLSISDGAYQMQIWFIGDRSGHTSDYTIFYFPEEKMIFEDDLVWIEREGEARKAGKTQAGFYKAVTDLGLNVKSVIQSWGTSGKYKTMIEFEEIGKTMGK